MDTILERKQIQNEQEIKKTCIEKKPYQQYKLIEKGLEHFTVHGKSIIYNEIHNLAEHIKKDIGKYNANNTNNSNFYKMITIASKLNPYFIAYTALQHAVSSITNPKTYTQIIRMIGKDCVAEYLVLEAKKQASQVGNQIIENMIKTNKYLRQKKSKSKLLKQKIATIATQINLENSKYEFLLGIHFIQLLLETSRFFIKKRVHVSTNSTPHIITVNDKAKNFITNIKNFYCFFGTSNEPMLAKPKDWQTGIQGGYLTNISNKKKLITVKYDNEHSNYINNLEMPQVYKCVNKLQKVPLRINKKLYEVLTNLIDNGSTLGDLPSKEDIKNKSYDKTIFKNGNNPKPVQATRYVNTNEIKENNRNKLLTIHRALTLAKKYLNDTFYNTIYIDYRGRIYTTGELSQINKDSIKALIEFTKGKKLKTKSGIESFLIYGANLFGLDKKNYDERLAFIIHNDRYIIASANNPYDNKFWVEADKPFLFLAWCFEYLGYKASGLNHISHLPISVDATCSGSQHLAMLMQDEVLAPKVNLTNSNINDFYTDVLNDVIKILESDLNNENKPYFEYITKIKNDGTIVQYSKTTNKKYAKEWIKLGLTRKDVKLCVMTEAYNATERGFKKDIYTKILQFIDKSIYFTDLNLYECAKYLAKKLKQALKIQLPTKDKLNYFLSSIIKKTKKPFIYTTKSGFLMKQSHYSNTAQNIKFHLPYKTPANIRLRQYDYSKIDTKKQNIAAIPNLIHALDATHLVLSVNKATEEINNFNVLTQHDCIATHACDVPKLKKILKIQMLDMYQDDILLDIKKQHESTYNVDLSHIEQPTKGEFNRNEILKSQYFFN